jgi:penicillin-binding protein 1C
MDWQDHLRKAKRRARLARVVKWFVTALAATNATLLVLLALVFVVPLPSRDAHASVVVEYRDGRPAYVFLTKDEKWRLPVELSRVDPAYVRALVALEDKRFYSHDGVDPIAILRAAKSNL